MLSLQQRLSFTDAADPSVGNSNRLHSVAHIKIRSSQPPQEVDKAVGSAGEEGETSTTDVVLALSGQQVMVEDSKKRSRAHRGSATSPGGTARHGSSRVAVVNTAQDAFAVFTTKYRDVLGDADVEEAEAVYSMVALTQAKAPDWSRSKQAVAAAAELPEGRPAKRRQVVAAPAGPACSEGGSSDSSAKSAPSPTPAQPGAAPTGAHLYQGMMPGPLITSTQQMHVAGDTGHAMLGSSSMPMAPGFFPGMGMMGLAGAPGTMGGVPMPPFVPPWAVPPMMFPSMFGSMGMFGPVPPGSPSLMSMPGPGMLPGMSAMPPAFMPRVPVSGCMGAPPANEPAAGFPVSGPVPAAVVTGAGARSAAAAVPPGTTVSGPAKGSKPAAGQAHQQKQQVGQGKQPTQPTACQKQQQGRAEWTAGSPNSSVTAAVVGGATSKQHGVATAVKAACSKPVATPADVHQELEQLDVSLLKPWVLTHFCEDVYLLLLDVWRPGSPKVRDAIWAWKLHVKTPQAGGGQPDYRAFLVSLFGLEKLLQLTAAVKAGASRGTVPLPAPLLTPAPAAAAVGGNAAGSGDSAAENVTLVAAGSRMLTGLTPAASGTVVGSATSPHVLGLTVQPQPA